jgi:hypothetical protein
MINPTVILPTTPKTTASAVGAQVHTGECSVCACGREYLCPLSWDQGHYPHLVITVFCPRLREALDFIPTFTINLTLDLTSRRLSYYLCSSPFGASASSLGS